MSLSQPSDIPSTKKQITIEKKLRYAKIYATPNLQRGVKSMICRQLGVHQNTIGLWVTQIQRFEDEILKKNRGHNKHLSYERVRRQLKCKQLQLKEKSTPILPPDIQVCHQTVPPVQQYFLNGKEARNEYRKAMELPIFTLKKRAYLSLHSMRRSWRG